MVDENNDVGLLPSLLGQYGSDESDSEPEENGATGDAAGRFEQSDGVEKGTANENSGEEQGKNGQREVAKSDEAVAVVNGSTSDALRNVKAEQRELTKGVQAPHVERQKRDVVARGEERVGADKNTIMVEFLSTLPKEFQCSGSRDGPISVEVDSKTERLVQQWKHLKDQGYTITDDLRKRKWYKSPDCMRLMVEKFEIDSGGSNLKSCVSSKEQASSSRENVTIAELRKAWDAYEAKRKMERKSGDARVDFVKGKDPSKYDDSAVSKAVLAAQKRAAAFTANQGERDKKMKR